jgi:hypothetical protein
MPTKGRTGCSGDVTAGKYSDGSPQAQAQLAQRLKVAMLASIGQTEFAPAKSAIWRTDSLTLPLRAAKDQVTAQSRAWLENTNQSDSLRVYEGAMRLSYVARLSRPILVSSLQLGEVHILHLPGEPMVDYQFFAQQTKPRDFVAVAGYGDCGPAYICTDKAITEGGYESSASNVGPGTEALLKKAIQSLLGAGASARP